MLGKRPTSYLGGQIPPRAPSGRAATTHQRAARRYVDCGLSARTAWERPYFVEKIMAIDPNYELLYLQRPGLFSYATLYNGYTDTMEKMLERLRMDLDYCRNRTMWTDIKIIYLTTVSILTGKKF